MAQTKKEKMFEAEMTNQQLEQLQQYLDKLNSQMNEIALLQEEIKKYGSVKEGTELLVPVASGIFVRAHASADKTFMMNIGAGVVVPKTEEEVLEVIGKQLSEMKEYESKMHEEFNRLLARLTLLQDEFAPK